MATVRAGRRTTFVAIVPAALVAVMTAMWIGVNFDVRYVLGGLRAAGAGGAGGVADVFVHRPLAYRALAAGIDALPRRLPDPTGPLAEGVVRFEALALVVAAAGLLGLGVQRCRPGPLGPALAVATGLTLALAPNWSFLEPDWVGVVAAVAAVGAALAFRPAVAGPVAGVLLLVTAVLKLTTAPYAVLALAAVAVVDRRRAARAALWAAGLGATWLLVTRFAEPGEWRWLLDMAALNPGSPLRVGLGGVAWRSFVKSAANTLVVSPVVVGFPAAAVVLVRASRRPGAVAATLAGAVALIAVPVVVQAQWFLYQWAALPVLTAALLATAIAVRAGSPSTVIALLAPVAMAGVASAVLLTAPAGWRAGRLTEVALAYLGLAAVGAVAVVLSTSRAGRTGGGIVAVLATVAALGAAQLPAAGYSFAGYSAEITNAGLAARTAAQREEFAGLRARIGTTTPVLYLAFGDVGYLLGNPTPCRYPSPVWLQRSTFISGLSQLATYQDNARCLADPAPRYLVWQRSWFDRTRLDPALDAELTRTYDCDDPLAVPSASVVACPRR